MPRRSVIRHKRSKPPSLPSYTYKIRAHVSACIYVYTEGTCPSRGSIVMSREARESAGDLSNVSPTSFLAAYNAFRMLRARRWRPIRARAPIYPRPDALFHHEYRSIAPPLFFSRSRPPLSSTHIYAHIIHIYTRAASGACCGCFVCVRARGMHLLPGHTPVDRCEKKEQSEDARRARGDFRS